MVDCDDNPIISIIVPVYGTEQYFDRCINSLLNQSYKNLEIIVVNDGSKGNISELIKQYTEDVRVKFIDNAENNGLLRARVCGSKKATGEYIAFVDSDDYVSFDFYRTLLNKAIINDADITIGKTVWENGDEKFIYNYHESSFHFGTLYGEQVKKAFFEQEYHNYSWHTIWNKLYKKNLWDMCLEVFDRVDRHVIMTEDIFFSSILFFNAKTVCHTDNDAYFYCVNENASTNSQQISIERFCKNISDIEYVFDMVEKYLNDAGSDGYICEGLYRGRQHYARMWMNLAKSTFYGSDKITAIKVVNKFCNNLGRQKVQDDYFFESVKTPWGGGLEYIKEKIRDCRQQYISFDIFDTLVMRPFYDPKDMFLLMDSVFFRLSRNNIAFSVLRQDAEELARKKYGIETATEDITLDEIYDFLAEQFGVGRSLTIQMEELECSLEKRYCRARNAGLELFELARILGKKVILISDMYLDRKTVEDVLDACEVKGYEKLYISSEEKCLKYNGHLFARVLSDRGISPKDIIHIGDSWKSDIEGSSIVGIDNIFLPKAIEVFENKIRGYITNRCADLGKDSCGDNIDYQKARASLGYRCMQAMAANEYFDNPYRPFNKDSDLNMDPYFIGFYPLGMHIAGIVKWIDCRMADFNEKAIVFLARDGYLPRNAYEVLKKQSNGQRVKIDYVQASRKALMPVMVKEVLNLYQLPIEYKAHSPKTICLVLSFLMDENEKNDFHKILQDNGFDEDASFTDLEEYSQFITFFINHLYSAKKHEEEKLKVKKYYRMLSDNAITFDMGYSGRIQAALCEAANQNIDVMFLHEDYRTSSRMKETTGFKIHSFYDFHPSISGLMREHIFSDSKGGCIGFEETNGEIKPIFEARNHNYPDRFVINTIQNAALVFLENFLNEFDDQKVVMNYSSAEVSIPFEGFLRKPSKNDMHIFSASYFEDLVFGASEDINIESFAMQNLAELGWNPKTESELEAERTKQSIFNDEDKRILNMINHSAQWKRAVTWLLMDRKFLMEKVHSNINRIKNKKK